MVRLHALLTAATIAVIAPHASFAAWNLTGFGIASIFQSYPTFEFPSLDFPRLWDSQQDSLGALLGVPAEAAFFSDGISSTERAIRNLASLAKTNGIWGPEHPIATLLDDIALAAEDIGLCWNMSTLAIDMDLTILLEAYDAFAPTFQGMQELLDVASKIDKSPKHRKYLEAPMEVMARTASQIFEVIVRLYGTLGSTVRVNFSYVSLATEKLEAGMIALRMLLASQYPTLSITNDLDTVSMIIAILDTKGVSLPKADEVALRGVQSWTKQLWFRAADVSDALVVGKAFAAEIQTARPVVKISVAEQAETLSGGAMSLRAMAEGVGAVLSVEETAQRIEDMRSILDTDEGSQVVFQEGFKFAKL